MSNSIDDAYIFDDPGGGGYDMAEAIYNNVVDGPTTPNPGEGCYNSSILENCTFGNTTDADVPRDFAVRVIIGVMFTIIILATIIGKY